MKKIAVSIALALLCGAAFAEPGETLYRQDCAACHQPDGKGVGHLIPPLAGSPLLLDEDQNIAALLLHGKAGMPAFGQFLKDADISAILTYARGAWGNAAPPVTTEAVAAARVSVAERVWKPPSN